MAGKLGDFLIKKNLFTLSSLAHTRDHFFHILVSYESFALWLCGKSEKKLEIFWVWGPWRMNFQRKSPKKVSFSTLKLQKSFCLDKDNLVPQRQLDQPSPSLEQPPLLGCLSCLADLANGWVRMRWLIYLILGIKLATFAISLVID